MAENIKLFMAHFMKVIISIESDRTKTSMPFRVPMSLSIFEKLSWQGQIFNQLSSCYSERMNKLDYQTFNNGSLKHHNTQK